MTWQGPTYFGNQPLVHRSFPHLRVLAQFRQTFLAFSGSLGYPETGIGNAGATEEAKEHEEAPGEELSRCWEGSRSAGTCWAVTQRRIVGHVVEAIVVIVAGRNRSVEVACSCLIIRLQ